MLKQGVVDLSQERYYTLVGRAYQDDFSDEAYVCALRSGEPVLQISAPHIVRHGQAPPPDASPAPAEQRVLVWAPHAGARGWISQTTTDGHQLIRWGVGGDPGAGVVDLTAVASETLALGLSLRDSQSAEAREIFALRSGDRVHTSVPEVGGRRIRIWAPRPNVVCWVWQSNTRGDPLIRWFRKTAPSAEDAEAILQVTADIMPRAGFVEGLRSKIMRDQPDFQLRRGDVVLRCPAGTGNAARARTECMVLAPGSERPVVVRSTDVGDLLPPLRHFLLHREGLLPDELLGRVSRALDAYAIQADAAAPGSEFSTLLGREAQQRDAVWWDLLDPDLCLCDPVGFASTSAVASSFKGLDPEDLPAAWRPLEWQTAEVDVDANGNARWASWLNHVDEYRHSELLDSLSDLLGAALPSLETICGRHLRSRRIQVVCRATDHLMAPDDQQFYHVSEWHTDGMPAECILATAVCYVDFADGLTGGTVEFAGNADLFLDDPAATEVVQPRRGSLLVFNNYTLRHRVNMLCGVGQRRLVALHLVDPDNPQRPSAVELPRQWREQQAFAIRCALAPMKLPLGRRTIDQIADFAADGCFAQDLVRLRLAERQRRLIPDHSLSGYTTGYATGTSTLRGTGMRRATGTYWVLHR